MAVPTIPSMKKIFSFILNAVSFHLMFWVASTIVTGGYILYTLVYDTLEYYPNAEFTPMGSLMFVSMLLLSTTIPSNLIGFSISHYLLRRQKKTWTFVGLISSAVFVGVSLGSLMLVVGHGLNPLVLVVISGLLLISFVVVTLYLEEKNGFHLFRRN